MASSESTRSPLPEPVPRTDSKGATELGEIVVFIDGNTEAPSNLKLYKGARVKKRAKGAQQ
jgi:hypothetical protein